MPTDPALDVRGDLDDAAISALARLLLDAVDRDDERTLDEHRGRRDGGAALNSTRHEPECISD